MIEDPPLRPERGQLRAIGAATGLGCSVVVVLGLLIGGGIALDQRFETSPLLTLIGVGLGLASAGGLLYELAKTGRGNAAAAPRRGAARTRNYDDDVKLDEE